MVETLTVPNSPLELENAHLREGGTQGLEAKFIDGASSKEIEDFIGCGRFTLPNGLIREKRIFIGPQVEYEADTSPAGIEFLWKMATALHSFGFDGSLREAMEYSEVSALERQRIVASPYIQRSLQAAFKLGFSMCWFEQPLERALYILKNFPLDNDVVQETAATGIKEALLSGNLTLAETFQKRFSISDDAYLKAAAIATAVGIMHPDTTPPIRTLVTRNDPIIAKKIIALTPKLTFLHVRAEFNETFQALVADCGITTFEQLFLILDQNPEYSSHLREKKENGAITLTMHEAGIAESLKIFYREAEELKGAAISLKELADDNTGEKLLAALAKYCEGWQNPSTQKNFAILKEIFSPQDIFQYAYHKRLSRHDAFIAATNIKALYAASGLTSKAFYRQILNEVRLDVKGSLKSSHGEFNAIAMSFGTDISRRLQSMQRLQRERSVDKDIGEVGTFTEMFSSWKQFRQASEFADTLERGSIVELLEDRERDKISDARDAFVFGVLTATNSKVDLDDLRKFITDPAAFLQTHDKGFYSGIEPLLSVDNLIEIEFLDLSATDLCKAIADKSIDGLTPFQPFCVTYQLRRGRPLLTDAAILQEIGEALGSSDKSALAKSQAKVEARLRFLFRRSGKTLEEVLEKGTLSESIAESTASIAAQIENILYDSNIGIDAPLIAVKFQIHAKSDPVAAVNGNELSNCMPLNSGKTKHFIANSGCAFSSIQTKQVEGKFRTFAASILTEDFSLEPNAGSLVWNFIDANGELRDDVLGMSSLIKEEILQPLKTVLSLDNIEVAPNYRDGWYGAITLPLYKDFLLRYRQQYPDSSYQIPDEIAVGDSTPWDDGKLTVAENRFISSRLLSYSDKWRVTAGMFTLKNEDLLLSSVSIESTVGSSSKISNDQTGVIQLTSRDIIPISYIEDCVFGVDKELLHHAHTVQNSILASEINNAVKGRPNYNLGYRDPETKTLLAYMLAFEGRDEKTKGPVIYISDFASLDMSPTHGISKKRAGAAILTAFLKQYCDAYDLHPTLPPIVVDAKEGTTYNFIKRRAAKIASELGLRVRTVDSQGEKLPTTLHRMWLEIERLP